MTLKPKPWWNPRRAKFGGTDEIQHNIIGENVLGLPRERSEGADVPFRGVPGSAEHH